MASPRFADKKLGYLGIMLLLDENTELLTMVTNSLQADMHASNMFVVGLALCTFANIASEEMSRDLVNEIEKLLGSSNVYIKKKAGSCVSWTAPIHELIWVPAGRPLCHANYQTRSRPHGPLCQTCNTTPLRSQPRRHALRRLTRH